jgi:hypothetical protein
MGESLSDRITRKLQHVEDLYHRLVLVVGLAGAGKTAALREVHKSTGAALISVSLELSRNMLDLTARQRILQVPRLLGDMVAEQAGNLVLLDNTEILFDVQLKQEPLRLLQGLSRNKTIVATWSGSIDSGHLIYAAPGHPEYRRYPAADLLVVSPEG